MESLEEKRKQDQLQAQIWYLRKTYLNQNVILSQELNIGEVLQSLHLSAEVVSETILRLAYFKAWDNMVVLI